MNTVESKYQQQRLRTLMNKYKTRILGVVNDMHAVVSYNNYDQEGTIVSCILFHALLLFSLCECLADF